MTEKSEKIYEAMTGISDELITEAEEYSFEGQKQKADRESRKTSGKNKIHYLKWGLAVAACLCVFGCGVLSGILISGGKEENPLEQTATSEERKSFQFLVHNMAMNNSAGSTNSNAPEALMSNYMNFSVGNSYTEIEDLYRLYGITSGDTIEKIVYYKGSKDISEAMSAVTNMAALEEFYRLTASLTRCNVNDFFDKVIEKMSEKEIVNFHEECITLEITTSNGLVFAFSVYPETGWLYCGGTMSYYALSEELLDWYEKNCSK